ncbi:MAG: RsmD family RNA methyltransferase [Bacteroidota bacterium]
MRIIAGTHKGRVVQAPGSLPVRPTTDYAKSGLFNILNNRVDFEEIDVLDLFAGAGGITFEFASRGARHVTAVDRYPGCVKFIRDTAKEFGMRAIETYKADVFKFLGQPSRQYDIVFADPPFDLENREDLVKAVLENGWVKENGMLILEHPSMEDSQWRERGETRRYGNCSFTFFKPESITNIR